MVTTKLKTPNLLTNERGFSLIEMIVVLIIIGTISAIAYGVILVNAKTFGVVSDEIANRWDLREAMNILRKDFTILDSQNIVSLASGSKLFFKDIDGNKIRYIYDGNKLRRQKNSGTWEVLLKNVKAAPFIYLDEDMNATANKDKLAYIKIRLTVNKSGKQRTAEDLFFVRNRMIEQPLTGSSSGSGHGHHHGHHGP